LGEVGLDTDLNGGFQEFVFVPLGVDPFGKGWIGVVVVGYVECAVGLVVVEELFDAVVVSFGGGEG